MKAIDYFSVAEIEKIQQAVKEAEQLTSGELRIYIEDHSKDEVLDRTAFIFSELNMHRTKERNGVLIYLAVKDKKFAVIGDAGIHAKVGDEFWHNVYNEMAEHFRQQQFTEGLIAAIQKAGEVLLQYFPYRKDDRNELPNDIVFGK